MSFKAKRAAVFLTLPFVGIGYSLFMNLVLFLFGNALRINGGPVYTEFSGYDEWTIYLIEAFLAPLLEEFIFRELLFRRLSVKMKAIYAALLSAFLFAVLHFDLVQAVYAFIFGLVLSEIIFRAGSFAAPAITHMAANLTALFMNESASVNEYVSGRPVRFLLLGILVFGVSLFLFEKIVKSYREERDHVPVIGKEKR